MKNPRNFHWKMIMHGIMVSLPLFQNGRQAKTWHLVCPLLNRMALPMTHQGTNLNWVQKLDSVLGAVFAEVLGEGEPQISWIILFYCKIYHPELVEKEIGVDIYSTSKDI